MLYFLVSYLVANLLIFLLTEHMNEDKASLGATILIALFGLPIFIVAGILVMRGNKS